MPRLSLHVKGKTCYNAAFNLGGIMFISIFIKFFFLMTPFFVLSMFLSMTQDMSTSERKKLAIRVTRAIIISCAVVLFFGQYIFDLFGITLDAFRIGAGALLFITAVSLTSGNKAGSKAPEMTKEEQEDISVVPLAIPITIGPGTVGALLVMGADLKGFSELVQGFLALLLAVLCLGLILYWGSSIEKIVGKSNFTILTKITGLILAALSAQIVFTGIKNFLEL